MIVAFKKVLCLPGLKENIAGVRPCEVRISSIAFLFHILAD